MKTSKTKDSLNCPLCLANYPKLGIKKTKLVGELEPKGSGDLGLTLDNSDNGNFVLIGNNSED
jgi:hypothetical protein